MKKRRRISQCPNCQSQLGFKDSYCPNCGQENHFHNNSMTELWEDFIGSLLNFDGKIWTTLKTLFLHPGQVSSDYVAGKKMSYVPPLRMYIFVSFFYFLILHFGVNMIMKSESVSDILKVSQVDTSFQTVEISKADFLRFEELNPTELALTADSILKNETLSKFSYQKYLNLKELNAFDSITVEDIQYISRMIAFRDVPENEEMEESKYNLCFFIKPEYDSLRILEPRVSFADLKKIYENPSLANQIVKDQTTEYSRIEKIGSSNMF